MDDYALVLNAGSSSVKFCVYHRPESEGWSLESRGQIESIGTEPRIVVRDATGRKLIDGKPHTEVRDTRDAVEALAAWLGSIYRGKRVVAVGHRVVHGGSRYAAPAVVTPEVLTELRALVPLAPLHQPHSLVVIEAVLEHLPDVPQVACFDTSFHRSQPAIADLIPLPREILGDTLRRYGFHGLSYEYIASVLPQLAPEIAGRRVIVAHLGNGASMCALKNGKSVDTSFGFSALDGLCMGTRPGSVDPGVILYLFESGLSPKEVETMLYEQSGLLGISGISSDMRDLLQSSHEDARLAVDYFVYRAAKEIGALTAALGGLDGLVFTAGIGENSAEIRRRICASSSWLGIDLDPDLNVSQGPRISAVTSKVSVWVIPTNEELMIAQHTGSLLGLAGTKALASK